MRSILALNSLWPLPSIWWVMFTPDIAHLPSCDSQMSIRSSGSRHHSCVSLREYFSLEHRRLRYWSYPALYIRLREVALQELQIPRAPPFLYCSYCSVGRSRLQFLQVLVPKDRAPRSLVALIIRARKFFAKFIYESLTHYLPLPNRPTPFPRLRIMNLVSWFVVGTLFGSNPFYSFVPHSLSFVFVSLTNRR